MRIETLVSMCKQLGLVNSWTAGMIHLVTFHWRNVNHVWHALDTSLAFTVPHRYMLRQTWRDVSRVYLLHLVLVVCLEIMAGDEETITNTDLYHHFRYKFKISPTLIWSPTAAHLYWSCAPVILEITNNDNYARYAVWSPLITNIWTRSDWSSEGSDFNWVQSKSAEWRNWRDLLRMRELKCEDTH